MNNISLIEEIRKDFDKVFDFYNSYLTLEHNFYNFGLDFTKTLFVNTLESLDYKFMKSDERKNKYYCKEIIERTIITCFGEINLRFRVYINKETQERYSLIKDLLYLKPYQRITDEAEYEIIKYAMHENMTQAGKYAIPNVTISRSWVSKKIAVLNGSIHREIKKSIITPETLYIEMDEIHANLQKGGNHICPCAIVHEGHIYNSNKRKALKNVHYFATAKGSYKDLWNEIYYYVNAKYDMDKIKYLFISGDGAPGIKKYDDAFPNAIFVLDKFHCNKYLKSIFKNRNKIDIALSYLLNDDIYTFNKLVDIEIDNNLINKNIIINAKKYILNNIEGIKNQKHEKYLCPCSMESHVNHGFARYITSSPYGFSLNGLENKLKLLVYNANKIELTFEDYNNLKYNENELFEINKKIYAMQNIKFKYSNLLKNDHNKEYNYNISLPLFDNESTKDILNNILRIKNF